jgi:hypothetical protein
MKNVLYIVLSLVLLTGFSGGKVVTYLQDRGGVKYEVNTEVPFTGVYVEKWDNGQKKKEEHYRDGKLDGLWTIWYENGQKDEEGNYKNRRKDGRWTEWWEDGQEFRELNYKDGKADGLWTFWDEEGNITKTKTY